MSNKTRDPSTLESLSRREAIGKLGVTAAAIAGVIPGTMLFSREVAAADKVKVGILHSLSGTIAIAEKSVVDAEMLAIEQVNKAGGVMGKLIEPVIEDGASDWPTFAEKARKLLEKDKVAAVMGCYTSASRKAVLPVFEKLNGLLYYPTYYEGLEQSPNIMYTAQEATQSVISAMEWLYANKGKSFYMIGSDYIWPRTTIKIAKATLARLGGKLVGEGYYPLGHIEFSSEINKIKAAKPDVILNCVVGGSNVAFFKQLTAAGINGKNQTVLSLAVSEEEVSGIGAANTAGTLTCMGYFQVSTTQRTRNLSPSSRRSMAPIASPAIRWLAATPPYCCGQKRLKKRRALMSPKWLLLRRTSRSMVQRARSSSTSRTITCGSMRVSVRSVQMVKST